MVTNNKLLETLFTCTKYHGNCKGCFYGDSSDQPDCIFHLMNDLLYFFGNPVPNDNAQILPLEQLQEMLSDRKDHIAFAEYINSIHVATPVIRTISRKGNFITLYDPQTNTSESFNVSDYYTMFRVWSEKPSDKLRNATPWTPINEFQSTDDSPINHSKTSDIFRYVSNMTQNSLDSP